MPITFSFYINYSTLATLLLFKFTSSIEWLKDAPSTTQSPPPQPLQDRVAIVTGSSRGIGRAIALHLASLGAKLVINYTSNSTQVDLIAAQINSSTTGPPYAITVQADISDPVQVKHIFDLAESAFNSPLYILVNSAAVENSKHPSVPDTSLEDFDKTFGVNIKGAFLCCKEAANRLKKGKGWRIICMTMSLLASLRRGYGAYTAAVEAMAKIPLRELKGTGITTNCVAPGPTATDMLLDRISETMVKMMIEECPLGRLGKTDDVAPIVGFLASDAGEWVNGQVIRVNGGTCVNWSVTNCEGQK